MQVAAGVFIGGLVLLFLVSVISAYSQRNQYEREILDDFFSSFIIFPLTVVGLALAAYFELPIIAPLAFALLLLLALILTAVLFMTAAVVLWEKRLSKTSFGSVVKSLNSWWLEKPQLVRKVIGIVLVLALIFGGIDLTFQVLNRYGIY